MYSLTNISQDNIRETFAEGSKSIEVDTPIKNKNLYNFYETSKNNTVTSTWQT